MTNTNNVPRPTTDLDFQQQLTDPFVSSPYIDSSFSNKFKEYVTIYGFKCTCGVEYVGEQNNVLCPTCGKNNTAVQSKEVIKRDLWSILQLFTRDWRLGNIDKREEAVYIRYYIDLTTDILVCLGDEYREVALICMGRALNVNETSQSKSGFLRKMLNTFIHKTTPNDDDKPTKRNLLGMGKKKEY